MTSFDSSPIDALEGMLEERRRYETWLAQLDARRGDAPAHVVNRVRSDYAHRLEGVTQQLRDRATDLEASAAGLRERIATVLHEESLHRDERAELELRALVGEFAPDRAQGSIASCDESIARLEGERHGFEHELTRIVDVLALVTPAPASPEPDVVSIEDLVEAAEVASSDVVADGAAPGDAPGSPTSADSVPDDAPLASQSSHMDELAFLQSVVDLPPEEPAIAGPAEVDAPVRARQQGEAELLSPPLLTVPRRPETPQSTAIPGGREPYGIPTKGSMLTPGSMPSFFKDMPTEQVKTLKCQECGTMNYPTEWYCERCGGELATM